MKNKMQLFGEITGICLISLALARSQTITSNVFETPLKYIAPTFVLILGILTYINSGKMK